MKLCFNRYACNEELQDGLLKILFKKPFMVHCAKKDAPLRFPAALLLALPVFLRLLWELFGVVVAQVCYLEKKRGCKWVVNVLLPLKVLDILVAFVQMPAAFACWRDVKGPPCGIILMQKLLCVSLYFVFRSIASKTLYYTTTTGIEEAKNKFGSVLLFGNLAMVPMQCRLMSDLPLKSFCRRL